MVTLAFVQHKEGPCILSPKSRLGSLFFFTLLFFWESMQIVFSFYIPIFNSATSPTFPSRSSFMAPTNKWKTRKLKCLCFALPSGTSGTFCSKDLTSQNPQNDIRRHGRQQETLNRIPSLFQSLLLQTSYPEGPDTRGVTLKSGNLRGRLSETRAFQHNTPCWTMKPDNISWMTLLIPIWQLYRGKVLPFPQTIRTLVKSFNTFQLKQWHWSRLSD